MALSTRPILAQDGSVIVLPDYLPFCLLGSLHLLSAFASCDIERAIYADHSAGSQSSPPA